MHYVHKHCRLLFFTCKIGDFKIAGLVCLQKRVCLLSPKMYFFVIFKIMHWKLARWQCTYYIVYSEKNELAGALKAT